MDTNRNVAPERLTDEELRGLLEAAHIIAVVGLSDDPWRPSYGVATYLQHQGYRIIPVNPEITEVLGERAYPDLASVPFDVDIVDLFRRPAVVGAHVDQAIAKGTKLIWMQLGVYDSAAAQRARATGIPVVSNRCLKIDHARLIGSNG